MQPSVPRRKQLLIHRRLQGVGEVWEGIRCRDSSLQDERVEHVRSQELLTGELTSRSEWVRIIHMIQTFAVTVKKTAGPALSFHPSSFTPSLILLHKSWVNYIKWARPLPTTTILDSLLFCGWLQGESKSQSEGFLWTSVCVKSSGLSVGGIKMAAHWTWEGDSETSDQAGSCRVSGGTMDVDMWEKSRKTSRG